MKKTWQKIFVIFLVFMMCVSIVAVFSFSGNAQAATVEGYTFENETLRHTVTGVASTEQPEIQVVGTKVYYVWHAWDGSGFLQIWTAHSDLDGSNFVATQ